MQAEGDQLQAALVRQVRVRGPTTDRRHREGRVPLPDRQGTLMERPGRLQLALGLEHIGQVVQAVRSCGVVGAAYPLPDRQGALMEPSGGVQLALAAEHRHPALVMGYIPDHGHDHPDYHHRRSRPTLRWGRFLV